MWSRASTDMASGQHGVAVRVAGAVVPAIVALLLAACGSAPPTKPTEAASAPVAAAAGKGGATAPGAKAGTAGAPGAVPNVPVTARGKADFDRAVGFMRSGNN